MSDANQNQNTKNENFEFKDIYKGLYGLTLKINNKREPVMSDYDKVLAKISARGEIINLVSENLTKDRRPTKLHIHALVKFDRVPLIKSLAPPGLHIKLEKIYNHTGWMKYMFKNERVNNSIYMF